MLRDEASPNDGEAGDPGAPPAARRVGHDKVSRYQCPADVVAFRHKPCSGTLASSLSKKNSELWLIKAPASFDPESFRGVEVPLSGLQTLQVPAAAGGGDNRSSHQIYSVLASSHNTSELHLLTSGSQSSRDAVFGPAFSGFLNVCESYGDSGTNQAPNAIPAAPAPSIPPGLRQRFQPFGSKTPTRSRAAICEADGPSPSTPQGRIVKHLPEEEEEGVKKRKKKKKREKSIKVERDDEGAAGAGEEWGWRVKVKEEVVDEEPPSQEGGRPEERRKRKRKKRDRETEEDRVVKQEVTVKCEPTDASYGDEEIVDRKKKKKKKRSKAEED
ncbi:CD3e molecule, epsilon associated protein [Lampris incognitus]|uniref:CD3e molecule, epsilon associated protein n=1 Tax=Lampris incognitus TaxID=2546036 RepID=UPI0024B4B3AE|nr:CD3e molecule, epsilon associated protein [Lampris incognitus]XP_056139885.1 CD3e molecule, epsilon associated protein [Lampris incognitus]